MFFQFRIFSVISGTKTQFIFLFKKQKAAVSVGNENFHGHNKLRPIVFAKPELVVYMVSTCEN